MSTDMGMRRYGNRWLCNMCDEPIILSLPHLCEVDLPVPAPALQVQQGGVSTEDPLVKIDFGNRLPEEKTWRPVWEKQLGSTHARKSFFDGIPAPAPAPALQVQQGGTHYKTLAIQPVTYIHANGIGFFEGNVIKYVTRWRAKGGIGDLEKAKHYIELLIELEKKP